MKTAPFVPQKPDGSFTMRNAGNIAIIAGRGSLPVILAEELIKSGRQPFLIGIEGEHEDWIRSHDHVILGWGQFGGLFKYLRENNCTRILLAGGVTRPRVNIAKMDWMAIKTLPQILAFMMGGDNSLLSGVIKVFEKNGVEVVGAHEVMPDLLAQEGRITGPKPGKKARANMEKAFEACKMLGQLDIGQAAVAVGNRVVAVEGIEGTDAMLQRVAELRANGKLTEAGRDGVLVKTMKPGQDMRVDLPAIGPQTVMAASNAGLAGVAVEAEKSFILNRDEAIAEAQDSDIFIYGH
ncbi:MAG: UDP-2,3-diacylglucosamine diphosphatase LpxI [Pseudomonadota bacterium]